MFKIGSALSNLKGKVFKTSAGNSENENTCITNKPNEPKLKNKSKTQKALIVLDENPKHKRAKPKVHKAPRKKHHKQIPWIVLPSSLILDCATDNAFDVQHELRSKSEISIHNINQNIMHNFDPEEIRHMYEIQNNPKRNKESKNEPTNVQRTQEVYGVYNTISLLKLEYKKKCTEELNEKGVCTCSACSTINVITDSLKIPLPCDIYDDTKPTSGLKKKMPRKKIVKNAFAETPDSVTPTLSRIGMNEENSAFLEIISRLQRLENRLAAVEKNTDKLYRNYEKRRRFTYDMYTQCSQVDVTTGEAGMRKAATVEDVVANTAKKKFKMNRICGVIDKHVLHKFRTKELDNDRNSAKKSGSSSNNSSDLNSLAVELSETERESTKGGDVTDKENRLPSLSYAFVRNLEDTLRRKGQELPDLDTNNQEEIVVRLPFAEFLDIFRNKSRRASATRVLAQDEFVRRKISHLDEMNKKLTELRKETEK